jgi:hypothetical protein
VHIYKLDEALDGMRQLRRLRIELACEQVATNDDPNELFLHLRDLPTYQAIIDALKAAIEDEAAASKC